MGVQTAELGQFFFPVDNIWWDHSRRIQSTAVALGAVNNQLLMAELLQDRSISPVFMKYERLFPVLVTTVSTIELVEAAKHIQSDRWRDPIHKAILFKAYYMQIELSLKSGKAGSNNELYKGLLENLIYQINLSSKLAASGLMSPTPDRTLPNLLSSGLVHSTIMTPLAGEKLLMYLERKRATIQNYFAKDYRLASQAHTRIRW